MGLMGVVVQFLVKTGLVAAVCLSVASCLAPLLVRRLWRVLDAFLGPSRCCGPRLLSLRDAREASRVRFFVESPYHSRLARFLESPTPVSARIYIQTRVTFW